MLSTCLMWLLPGSDAPLSSSTYLLWYALYAALFALFYVFSSPFTGNRELRKSWSGYVYVSTVLYVWLGMAVAFHLPILHYDVKVPVSLFSPLFLASALCLFACEAVLKLLNRWFVFHVGFKQNSLEVMQNAFVVSLACCLVYSQCGSVTNEGLRSLSRLGGSLFDSHHSDGAREAALLDAGIDRMCVVMFSAHVDSKHGHLPMVFVLWVTAMAALVLNFFIERISGTRGMFAEHRSSAVDAPKEKEEPTVPKRMHSRSGSLSRLPSIDESTPSASASASPTSAGVSPVGVSIPKGADDVAAKALTKKRKADAKKAAMRPGNAATVGAEVTATLGPAAALAFVGASASPTPSPASMLASSYKSSLRRIRPNLFKDMLSPPMLEMVPWYALLTTFTGVDMLIHLKLFVGRFDMRTLMAITPNSFHYTPPLFPNAEGMLEPVPHGAGSSMGSAGGGGGAHGFTSSNSLAGLERSASSIGVDGLETPVSPRGGGGGYDGGATTGRTPGFNGSQHSRRLSPETKAQRRAAAEALRTHVHAHHMDSPLVYDHCAQDEDLWFDWMSDCGDGWNSSYQVCRVLAKPVLNVSVRRKGGRKAGALRLPRGKLLVLGGDLAYPNPSESTYETRFFRPFQCALPPPLNYSPDALSMHKPPIPGGVSGLKDFRGPTCFAIPGNHDWFDGLQTYLRYICARDWLGGWLMPQERSFFALQLPKGWWLFGLDNALSDDIDAAQFKYFASIIERMDEDDRVIICTHEPDWIIDTHDQRTSGENTNYLIKILRGKVALRIAGDVHNYTRHMPSPLIPGLKPVAPPFYTRARNAFNASAASSLVRGVIDSIFAPRGSQGGDEEDIDQSAGSSASGLERAVSGVVDATLNRAAEAARLHAEEQAEAAAKAAASGADGGKEVSYTSMLYSRWTGWGGDGEGVYMEDILDHLDPAMPLLRTQSMPALPRGMGEVDFRAMQATAARERAARAAREDKVDEEESSSSSSSSDDGEVVRVQLGRGSKNVPADSRNKQQKAKKHSASQSPPAPVMRSASPVLTGGTIHQSQMPAAQRVPSTLFPRGNTAAAAASSSSSPPLMQWGEAEEQAEEDHGEMSAAAKRNKKKREAKLRKQREAEAASGGGGLASSSAVGNASYSSVASGISVSSTGTGVSLPHGGSSSRSIDGLAPSRRSGSGGSNGGALAAIHAWSVAEVLDWLSSVGVDSGSVHEAFSNHEIDGRLLLELDQDDLAGEMGVESKLKRKKILAEIRALVAQAKQDDDQAATPAAGGTSLQHQESEGMEAPGSTVLSPDDTSHNSEDEQLTANILTGSSLNLSGHDEVGGALRRKQKKGKKAQQQHQLQLQEAQFVSPFAQQLPSPPPPVVGYPVVAPLSPHRAHSGPDLSVTTASVPNASYVRRNVDPISSAAQAGGVEEDDEEETAGMSASARKRLAKKKKAQAAAAAAAGCQSLSTSNSVSPPASHAAGSKGGAHARLNPRSAEALGLPSSASTGGLLSPRGHESLFGSAATGTRANTPLQSSPPVTSSSSSSMRRSPPSHVAGKVSMGSAAPKYNDADSLPIPTDVRETINISFPEGSEAPPGMIDEDVGDDGFEGGIGGTGAGIVGDANVGVGGESNVRPPPVLIVSGGGGAFMHPTHVPDPEPILFRGNRYVRASSYPPVALSRAYSLLNLFGFRKQNWRFDIFGGVLYFLLAVSCMPVCNLDAVIHAKSWYEALWEFLAAVGWNHALIFLQGNVSLVAFIATFITLCGFGEVPWPWYKRLLIGTLHTLAHSFSAVATLVLLEVGVELGRDRKILGQGEFLYVTFTKNFPGALQRIDSWDTQFYGLFGMLCRFLSGLFDVPDNIATYKSIMCSSYATATRPQMLLYYGNMGLYLWMLMAPTVAFVFGAYLYIGSTFLNAHYTEAFSALRLEGYKNVLRFHINKGSDLEVYTLGLDRVPSKWVLDPNWSGAVEPGTRPSHEWRNPSVLRPEKGQPDRIKLIDYLVINKNPRGKNAFVKHSAAEASGRNGGSIGGQSSSGSAAVGGGFSAAQAAVLAAATSTRGPSIAHLVAPSSPVAGHPSASRRGPQRQPSLTPQSSPRSMADPPLESWAQESTYAQRPMPRTVSAAVDSDSAVAASLAHHRKQLSRSSGNIRPHAARQ